MRIALVAGEASGDILGASLLQALKSRLPQVEFEGIGGELMQAEGLESLYPLERLSVMGLVEVLGRLPELLRLRKRLVRDWRANPPDLFIGIDAPDFTLNLEKSLRAVGIPTVHYVSPSVWAWRSGRVKSIRQGTDLMLTLFPFEAEFYRRHQQPVAFVGHPLADEMPLSPDLQAQRQRLNLPQAAKVLALLPGSRAGEVRQLARIFLQTARLLYAEDPTLIFVMPAANPLRYQELETLIREDFAELPVRLYLKQSREIMMASDSILIASGTATLEAMMSKKPMVVAYRLAPMTYAILSRLVKSPWISLPNLLAQARLVPEVLQNEVTPERLAAELKPGLQDAEYCAHLSERFTELHQSLRRGASARAAEAILDLLRAKGVLTSLEEPALEEQNACNGA